MIIPIYKLGNIFDAIDSGEFEDVKGTYDAPSEWKLTTLNTDMIDSITIVHNAKYRGRDKTLREDVLGITLHSSPDYMQYFKTDNPVREEFFKLVKLINDLEES